MKKINASELKSYLNHGFKIEEIKGNFLRIETSFLDNMNDFIDLYLVQEKNRIIITDDGFLLYYFMILKLLWAILKISELKLIKFCNLTV